MNQRTAESLLPQDLHIHTIFSWGDCQVVREQTLDCIAWVRHAKIIGIADHLDFVYGERFSPYAKAVREKGFLLGVEVDGASWVETALEHELDYYFYHCPDKKEHYRGLEKLLESGRPVVVSHPVMWGTNLKKVPDSAILEINNRYIWRTAWRSGLKPFCGKFRFVLSSDAHEPSMLNQNVARCVGRELGIRETLFIQGADGRIRFEWADTP